MSHSRSEAVIAFIDLAGFSAATDVYGDEMALAMLGLLKTSSTRHWAIPLPSSGSVTK